MRRFLVILALMLALAASPARAGNVMVGSVVSVDRENGEVEVRPLGLGAEKDGPDGETIKISVSPDRLPSFVVDGARVRVWGDWTPDARTGVAFSPLRGAPPGGGPPGAPPPPPDPTGVRSRITQGLHRPGGIGPPLRPGPPKPGGKGP